MSGSGSGSLVLLHVAQPEGEQALRWALDWRARHGDEGRLHVVLAPGDTPGAPAYVPPAHVAALERRLLDEGVAAQLHLPETDVARQVVDLARDLDAAGVVLGVQPRSPVMKAVLGSVARRIVLEAPCPVTTVKE